LRATGVIGRTGLRAAFASRGGLFVALALLALFAQILGPISRANASPSTPAEVVAELRASFGDVVQICVHVDDGASGLAHPKGACDDCCPLCGGGAAPVVFPPGVAALPAPLDVAAHPLRPTQTRLAPASARASPALPRGPPSRV